MLELGWGMHKDMNAQPLACLPSLPGTYVLVLRISQRQEILVSTLGSLDVDPGFYLYVGSALGPGGLAKRIGRHARAEKKCCWHIDYLTAVATLDEVWYRVDDVRRECYWAECLKKLHGATLPLEGFGSSDCRCRSHLFHFQALPSHRVFRQRLVRLLVSPAATIAVKSAADELVQQLELGGTRR